LGITKENWALKTRLTNPDRPASLVIVTKTSWGKQKCDVALLDLLGLYWLKNMTV